MNMHLDLDELLFALVFLVFTLFLISVIPDLVGKLVIVVWLLLTLTFVVYILLTRDKERIYEDFTTWTECDPDKDGLPLTRDKHG